MTLSNTALANRTMGAFTLSIGTSLALESIAKGTQAAYDPERVIPNQIKISEYDEVWVNLATLYRNIMGAMTKEGISAVMPDDISEVMEFETNLISQVIKEVSHGKTKVIYYASDYAGLDKHFPYSRIREDSTDKQKMYTSIMVNALNSFYKRKGKDDSLLHFDLYLQPKKRVKALIITHYAFDLLSDKEFTELDLLETHTGLVKKKSSFYTKLTDGKNLVRIPFSEFSMQVFGDSQIFHGLVRKVKEEVLKIAEHYKWTALTKKDRILMSIESISDKETMTLLKNLL